MSETGTRAAGSAVGRLFRQQPERVAAAWRKVRGARVGRAQPPVTLLDNVVEGFIREVGNQIAGSPGDAWTRTGGVLRVSPERGVQGLSSEFNDLLRCLEDAVDGLSGTAEERALVHRCVDDALDSALALHLQVIEGETWQSPVVPFGGLVIEFFEAAASSSTVGETVVLEATS